MKFIILFGAILAMAESFTYFTTANEHLDVIAIMKKPANEKYIMDCFLDKTDCDSFVNSYKKNIVEAVFTACYRCTDEQKRMWTEFLYMLMKHYPEDYTAFQMAYDPFNLYMSRFLESVKVY